LDWFDNVGVEMEKSQYFLCCYNDVSDISSIWHFWVRS